mmetsp:Transcript_4796/g.13813  ORF Transcript_4796/g.13813 Transcript_4796/m.13813 type:complete len:208 (+) Transcript_4796:4154-4777(+)
MQGVQQIRFHLQICVASQHLLVVVVRCDGVLVHVLGGRRFRLWHDIATCLLPPQLRAVRCKLGCRVNDVIVATVQAFVLVAVVIVNVGLVVLVGLSQFDHGLRVVVVLVFIVLVRRVVCHLSSECDVLSYVPQSTQLPTHQVPLLPCLRQVRRGRQNRNGRNGGAESWLIRHAMIEECRRDAQLPIDGLLPRKYGLDVGRVQHLARQ